jgi:hypothetical protein
MIAGRRARLARCKHSLSFDVIVPLPLANMTRICSVLCVAFAALAGCVATSCRGKLVHAGGGLAVEEVEEWVPRAGSLWVEGELTWSGSRATARLTDVTFETWQAAADIGRLSGDGDPAAVRLMARRGDRSAYTATANYWHCYDDQCYSSPLNGGNIPHARRFAGPSGVRFDIQRFPMMPDVVELRVMAGSEIAFSLRPPKDRSVTLSYGHARAEHRRAFDLGDRTTVLEWSAVGPRWMRAIPNAVRESWPMSATPHFIAPASYERRYRVSITDGFQLVNTIVKLGAQDKLPKP